VNEDAVKHKLASITILPSFTGGHSRHWLAVKDPDQKNTVTKLYSSRNVTNSGEKFKMDETRDRN